MRPSNKFQVDTRWTSNSIKSRKNQNGLDNKKQINGKKIDFNWIPTLTLFTTLFTAVSFGAGKAYRQKYLALFGFNDTLIPWSFQDVVYLGILTQVETIIMVPVFAIGMLVIIIAILWLMFKLKLFLEKKANKKPTDKRDKKDNNKDEYFIEIMDFFANLMNFSGIVLIALILTLFFAAQAEKRGKTDAVNHLSKIETAINKKEKYQGLDFAKIDRELGNKTISQEGYIITCSEKLCGIYDENKTSHIIPIDNIISFKYEN